MNKLDMKFFVKITFNRDQPPAWELKEFKFLKIFLGSCQSIRIKGGEDTTV